MAVESRENLSYRPIDLFDDVTVEAALGLAAKFLTDPQWNVGHGVGHIEKKRSVTVRVDEMYGSLGIASRELRDIGIRLDNFVALHQREGRIAIPALLLTGAR